MALPMGPPSTVRAQSCHTFSHFLFFILLSTGDVVFLFNIGMINQMRRLFSEFHLCLVSFKISKLFLMSLKKTFWSEAFLLFINYNDHTFLVSNM